MKKLVLSALSVAVLGLGFASIAEENAVSKIRESAMEDMNSIQHAHEYKPAHKHGHKHKCRHGHHKHHKHHKEGQKEGQPGQQPEGQPAGQQ